MTELAIIVAALTWCGAVYGLVYQALKRAGLERWEYELGAWAAFITALALIILISLIGRF